MFGSSFGSSTGPALFAGGWALQQLWLFWLAPIAGTRVLVPFRMEGPTPVSALIHAATMVTAGVYMIGRNAVLFTHAPHTLEVVAAIGVATGAATARGAGEAGLGVGVGCAVVYISPPSAALEES